MPKAFLIAALLLLGQKPQETGIVVGIVVAPASQQISPPVQVILLPAQYRDLWNSDLQKRLDVYWEHYKPAFARRKEFFFEVSTQAHKEATNYVITRMRRDPSNNFSNYLSTLQRTEDSNSGTFRTVNTRSWRSERSEART